MPAKVKLRSALNAIDDAKRALKKAEQNAPNDQNIRQAIRELDDAEAAIEYAIREIDQD